jgi:hypothetical protein
MNLKEHDMSRLAQRILASQQEFCFLDLLKVEDRQHDPRQSARVPSTAARLDETLHVPNLSTRKRRVVASRYGPFTAVKRHFVEHAKMEYSDVDRLQTTRKAPLSGLLLCNIRRTEHAESRGLAALFMQLQMAG